ncbi:MAG: redoxin domain-containing protein [Elusimicrobia bacterium]|nr:redoxin domain-containing protein [Elusimicrobiota bacterium]
MTTTTLTKPTEPIAVGSIAPEFTLKDQNNQDFRLSDYRGKKPVVLFFYPLDWSPTCTVENKCFSQELNEFSKYAEVVGISVDSVWSHKAWADALHLQQRLLSDMNRETIKKYGLFFEPANISQRATVIVDKNGKVAWVKVQSDIKQARDMKEVLKVLQNLK